LFVVFCNSYSSLINCWAKSNREAAPDAAQKLLLTMKQQYLAGEESYLRPNTIAYSAVISALARAGQAEGAEALLEEMDSDYLDGNDSCKPNVLSFSVVWDAWSKSESPDAPQHAESILERMTQQHAWGALDTKPNTVSYNTMINCWAKSNRKDAPDAAQKLLLRMKQQYNAGDESVRPNSTITYSAVISVFARAGQAERAEALLEEMYSDYLDGNDSCKQ
jgi:pentatricopeptide repeat protein